MLNKLLKRDLRRCQTLNNLKNLSLGDWCVDDDLHALIHLLGCSPVIQKLTLRLRLIGASASHHGTDESEVKVNCKHFMKFKITCVQGDTRVPSSEVYTGKCQISARNCYQAERVLVLGRSCRC
ncbi:hypothetical protein PAHAL_3G293700 [Panicum hallii]|uniref:FBD domain-containing protein n=1 Tax=Panicum hallii TaxID=206008 RepID=A0A2T8KJU8_9POAL|nr:hypothetical protein PAHAL_3G293700 [Panicum hallii]